MSRRVYAYLRDSEHGKTYERHIGDVTVDSREEALRVSWKLARQKGLLNDPPYRSTGQATRGAVGDTSGECAYLSA